VSWNQTVTWLNVLDVVCCAAWQAVNPVVMQRLKAGAVVQRRQRATMFVAVS
jgi:hypothetical protein